MINQSLIKHWYAIYPDYELKGYEYLKNKNEFIIYYRDASQNLNQLYLNSIIKMYDELSKTFTNSKMSLTDIPEFARMKLKLADYKQIKLELEYLEKGKEKIIVELNTDSSKELDDAKKFSSNNELSNVNTKGYGELKLAVSSIAEELKLKNGKSVNKNIRTHMLLKLKNKGFPISDSNLRTNLSRLGYSKEQDY